MHEPNGHDVSAQLGELLELAGSVEALLETVDELTMVRGRRPELGELVDELMARKRLGFVGSEADLASF